MHPHAEISHRILTGILLIVIPLQRIVDDVFLDGVIVFFTADDVVVVITLPYR